MTARPVIWAAGLAGSVAAHGVALGLLILAIRPDPVTEQPMPQSEIQVDAYQLDQSRAREQQPDADAAKPADASGTAIGQGTIRRSQADLLTPQAQSVPGAQPRSDRLGKAAPAPVPALAATPEMVQARLDRPDATSIARITPQAAVLSQLEPPRPEPIAAAAQAVQPAAAVQVMPVSAAIAAPNAQPVLAVLRDVPMLQRAKPSVAPAPVVQAAAPVAAALVPQPSPVAPAAADPADLPETRPDPVPVAYAPPEAALAVATTPQGERAKAALAFSGDGGGEVDPVSLAAFQAFMQPGDIQTEGDPLRDGVSGLLAQVPCSRLQVGFDPDSATLQVNGHIPEGDMRAPVLAALKAQMGADIAVSDNILILPRPQCGALSGISDVGLPQSTDQITNPLLIGQDTHARVLDFVDGQRLWFDLTAPEYDAYVYVDYFDAGGSVLHLAPNDQVALTRTAANGALRIGTKQDGDTGMQMFIGPPYGQEIAVAFAASEPLYDGLRPLVEPAADYLVWLKSRVALAREQHPDFKGEWVYFFVTTAAE